MSSRHDVSRVEERSRSRTVASRRGQKSDDEKSSQSRPRDKSKHRSSSRDKKHKSKRKKKKKKHSRSSSTSSSSGASGAELQLLQRLEAERLRLKEEKKKQKELMKANETPEQKRERRLKEKQEKERRRRERMGWDTEYQCYTNQDNPFGDSALTNTFVWGKKLAKEGVKNVSHDELEALNRQKQLENKIELEKVKQRRLEREAERGAREAEAAAAARAREAAQFSSWARQEDAFHLHQARLRSQIRIRDGRAKPIDLLAWYVSSEQCADALEMHEPYTYLNGLQAADLEDLLADIAVYQGLEDADRDYWRDVRTIVQAELEALRRLAAPAARLDGVHRAVADDVTLIFKGKSGAQLEALEAAIERKMSAPHAGVDVGYWESLRSQLRAHRARRRLRDRHQRNLRAKLRLLTAEQGVRSKQEDAEPSQQPPPPDAAPDSEPERASGGEGGEGGEEGEDADEAQCAALYRAGRYSPPPLPPAGLEPGTLLTEPALDEQRLAYLRAALRPAPAAAPAAPLEAPLAPGEAPFGGEHPLPDQPCLWADKYRPRKPRYFNRVHTGFEWNKYNQTHYDMDNPPPKVVQGYKFNIFYPDLIDKHSTPEFSLKPCGDNAEFAVLRFHAGPPYEDIAFKIVNREWEYSYKRGFRCHFHNNIFQLWFHFKRYRYRR